MAPFKHSYVDDYENTRRMDNLEEVIPRILIVDDDENLSLVLTRALMLTKAYTVDSALNGDEAEEMLKTFNYDVILLDIYMPGLSGRELLIKYLERYPEAAIIMITGKPDVKDAVELMKLGAVDYLSKPIDVEKLYSSVEAALKNQEVKNNELLSVIDKIPEDYQPVKLLSQTFNSTIVLVEKNDRYYAMKILNQDFVEDATKIKRFFREMVIMKDINHLNIVRVFEYNMTADGQLPYILMEYVPGISFDEYLATNPPMNERIQVFRGMISAVWEVHKNRIIHRDIKPENFLFSSQNEPKLTDFGLSKIKDSNLTMTKEISGSLYFMAPEMFESLKNVDFNSDIFSLGVVGYILFTGQKPFDGHGFNEIMLSVIKEKPIMPNKINPKIPAEIQNILAKMLEKKPKKRYQSIIDVSIDLDNYINNRKGMSSGGITSIFGKISSSVWA